MDSPWVWYQLAHHDALGGSFGRGTLRFVGFGPVERTMIYGVRRLDAAARGRWVERLGELGGRDARAALKRAARATPASPATFR
jgi:hypothetical protein